MIRYIIIYKYISVSTQSQLILGLITQVKVKYINIIEIMWTQITMRVETPGDHCDHLSLLIDNNHIGIQIITIVLYTKS